MCIHLLCLLLEFTEITEHWQSTQRRTNSPDCWPAPLTTLFVGQLRGRVQRVKRSQEGTCTRMWCPEALRSVLMPSTVIQMIDPSIGQCACVCKVSYESPMMAMAWNISYMYSLYSILVNKYPRNYIYTVAKQWCFPLNISQEEPGLHETFCHGSDEPHPISQDRNDRKHDFSPLRSWHGTLAIKRLCSSEEMPFRPWENGSSKNSRKMEDLSGSDRNEWFHKA